MNRKTFKLLILFITVLVMALIFAMPSFAETETFSVGDYGIVSIDVPNGATVTAWSGTPYGYFSFEDASVSGNTYSTGFTAILPGTATIRATVRYADNTIEFVTVKTYLNVLKNGIYTVGNDYADNNYSLSGEFYLRSQTGNEDGDSDNSVNATVSIVSVIDCSIEGDSIVLINE